MLNNQNLMLLALLTDSLWEQYLCEQTSSVPSIPDRVLAVTQNSSILPLKTSTINKNLVIVWLQKPYQGEG